MKQLTPLQEKLLAIAKKRLATYMASELDMMNANGTKAVEVYTIHGIKYRLIAILEEV